MRTLSKIVGDLIPETNPLFNVVLVCADFAARAQAAKICHRLTEQFKNHFSSQVATWTAALLRDPALNSIAIREAAEARVIVLAADCATLPSAVRKWVEGWRAQKARPPSVLAAVLNFPAGDEGSSAVEEYLRAVAADSGREFLVEKIAVPSEWRDDLISSNYLRELTADYENKTQWKERRRGG